MTDHNKELVQCLAHWLWDLEKHIENEPNVLFLHLDIDMINKEIITNVKLEKNDRKLQRSKQKTA